MFHRNISIMKDKQEFTYSKDRNEYEKIPAGDFPPKIEEATQKIGNYRLQFAAAISVSIFSMTMGTVYSWSSPALPHLKSNISEIPITDTEGSYLATVVDFGAFIGNILLLLVSSLLGRKNWILMLAIPFMVSWLIIIFAKNILLLYISRLICGVAGDFASALVPMYIGEIADKEIRGILLIMLRISANIGHMYVKAAGAFLSYDTMNIIMFFVPLTFFVTFIFMPESPYFLLIKNRREEALKTIMRLKGVKDAKTVQPDLDRMQKTVKESEENQGWMFRELFCIKGNRKSLMIVLVAWMTKFLCGSSAITAFTQEIFEGTGTLLAPEICAMILAIVCVIIAIGATFFIERLGRRITFLYSGIFCTFGLFIVGIFFFLKLYLKVDVESVTWLPLFGLTIFDIAFTAGFSYVPIILLGEMFALNIKIPAVFFINITISLFVISIKVGFQWLNRLVGIYTTFWLYGVCSLVGSIVFYTIAPETKGKTLEEIQDELHGRNVSEINEDGMILNEKC